MGRFVKYNNYLYIVLHIVIGLDVFNRTKDNTGNLVIFMGMIMFIVINNHLRLKYFYMDRKRYQLSVFVFMILSSILIYNIGGYSYIFQFTILYELIIFTGGKGWKRLIGLQIVNILTLSVFINLNSTEILSLDFSQETLIGILFEIVNLLFFIFILFAYRALKVEKIKVDRLNKELELSYNKLIEQSEEIEKLTIAKERNRVAGEIHDNLGHSLVALNMNLDVAEKLMDSDMDKTRELLYKAKTLSKESMGSLRKAVYALKEEYSITLTERLKVIIDNIQSTGSIEIILNIDEEIEGLSLEHKNVIYNCIKEAITNSIKHGKAEEISIDIEVKQNIASIIVKDNGLGCIDLVKGNGLMGIENRIKKINGKVDFDCEKNQGFKIEIEFLNIGS